MRTTMKSPGMVLVAKLYQLLKGWSACLQMVAESISIHWSRLPERPESHLHRQSCFICRRKTKHFLKHDWILCFCCYFNHLCLVIEPSSTLGHQFLEVKNLMYIASIYEPCGPESIILLFFWILVQEPLVGSKLVEIIVFSG
jgi:hypothetical protein